jgi:hypothetical protein
VAPSVVVTIPVVQDGDFDILKGKILTARSGSGGKGGDVILTAPTTTGESIRGTGGDARGVNLEGANGGTGSSGGDFIVTVGVPGALGAGTETFLAINFEPFFMVEDALNGDGSISPVAERRDRWTTGGHAGGIACRRDRGRPDRESRT